MKIFVVPIKKIKIIGNLISGFRIKTKSELTKEEIFQIIEKLLTIETID